MKPLAQACALVLAAGSLTMGSAIVAPTPAGSSISNQVTVTYQDAFGNSYSDESNEIVISIREVRSATLDADSVKVANTSDAHVVSTHVLTNTGNVTETYTLTAANVDDGTDTIDADEFRIWKDQNDNGTLDVSDYNGHNRITTIELAAGESVQLILEQMLPANIAATDNLTVTLKAEDAAGNEAVDMDTVSVTFEELDDNITDVFIMPNGNGSSCNAYTAIREGMDWDTANTRASSFIYNGKRGHLATFTTPEENELVKTTLNNSDAWWIGAERTIDNATFTNNWVTGEAFSYTNWFAGEPNTNAERGASFHDSTGQWNDAGKSTAYYSLVEFELGDCADIPKPKVDIELTGAKVACEDADNDGTTAPSGIFGTAILADMAPGECAVMRGNVANNGTAVAKSVLLYSKVFDDASDVMYVPNSLARCEGDACTPEVRTDTSTDGDAADYDKDGNKKAAYWFNEIAAGGKAKIQYSVKIK